MLCHTPGTERKRFFLAEWKRMHDFMFSSVWLFPLSPRVSSFTHGVWREGGFSVKLSFCSALALSGSPSPERSSYVSLTEDFTNPRKLLASFYLCSLFWECNLEFPGKKTTIRPSRLFLFSWRALFQAVCCPVSEFSVLCSF